MPSSSAKQHNFMEAVAHGWKPSQEKGPSVAVAKDFVAADKGSSMDEHAIKGHALKAITHALTKATAEHYAKHVEKKKRAKMPPVKEEETDAAADASGMGPNAEGVS